MWEEAWYSYSDRWHHDASSREKVVRNLICLLVELKVIDRVWQQTAFDSTIKQFVARQWKGL